MSETTSADKAEEPVQSWYREVRDGMPVSSVAAQGPGPADRAGRGPAGAAGPGPAGPAGPGSAGPAAPGRPGDEAGSEAIGPVGFEATAPAVRRPHWSGKKTAVAAALAVGLSSLGVAGVAAVVRDDGGTGFDGPAGGLGRQFPGGQAPNGQLPNGQIGPHRAGQLGQPNQQVPGQLTQPLSPFGDDDGSPADDDSSSATDT